MVKPKRIVVITVIAFLAMLGTYYLRSSSPLFNLFFSPSDLYENLYQRELNLSENEKHNFRFKTKYPGNHAIFVTVGNAVSIGEEYDISFVLDVEIKNHSGKVFIKEIVSKPVYTFWSKRPMGGVAVLSFKVPADAPIDEELTANVVVVEKDLEFNEKYGPVNLVLRKYSDE